MQNFQGVPSNVPTFGGLQVAQQPMQQPTLTGISVQAAPQQAQQRQLTGDSIRRRQESATRKGQNTYWQVNMPARELKLTGALAYVTRPGSQYANRQGNQQFVYWPRFRVAGTVQDIVNKFRQSGDPNLANLTEEFVLGEAINPLNPVQAQQLQNLAAQTTEAAGVGAGARRPRHSLEEYIMIGQAIKAASKGATIAGSATVSGARGGTGAGRGGRDANANRERLVADFQQLMTQALGLQPGQDLPRILNVTTFEPQRFTNAIRMQPARGPRATAIRPSIVVNGRRVPVPVSAQPSGAANFEAFVQNVIGQSEYAPYVQQILQSFREQLQQRQSAGTGAVQGFMLPQQVLGQGTLPTAFQAGPTVSVMSQLQQGAGSPGSPRSPGSSGAASPGTPRGAGAGFPLPTFGQGVAQTSQLPSISLPGTISGGGLPTVGLPTVSSIRLPGATSAFPQIPLPGQQ